MKKRKLEILLSKINHFGKPEIHLEQYQTPASVAAELLNFAYLHGDLGGKIYDLGCGTGILGIGAKLLGASRVVGWDLSWDALRIAKKNASKLGVEIDLICCDVDDVSGKADCVLMNPPFGAQQRGADRPFLKKAIEIAQVVYSIHNAGSYDFVKKFISPSHITHCLSIKWKLGRTYWFHRKNKVERRVELYRIVCRKEV
jgi:putative methylase